MAYARRYDFKGTETLVANVVRILQRDLPAEMAFINEETGATLPPVAEYLTAEKVDPQFPFVKVEPDEDDAVETEGGELLVETNQLDMTIACAPLEDLTLLTTQVMRYKRAVRNVLWAADASDLTLGITNSPAHWDVRGGRYRWTKIGRVFARSVNGMKLIVQYGEAATR